MLGLIRRTLEAVGCSRIPEASDVASHTIFTSQKSRAETISPSLNVCDLRTEEGKVSGLKKRYLADVILAELDPDHPGVCVQTAHARDRILGRPDPDPHRVEFGTLVVSDSFLAGFLDEEDRQRCLAKLLEVAGDPREAAFNRQDALTGARNLVIRLPAEDKAATFQFSKAFVHGERDGSHLDAEVTGRAHALRSFQIGSASASLRGHGMYLAAASATVLEEREWVRDRALDFLHSEDGSLVQAAAVTLSAIGGDVTGDIGGGRRCRSAGAGRVGGRDPGNPSRGCTAQCPCGSISATFLLGRLMRSVPFTAPDSTAPLGIVGAWRSQTLTFHQRSWLPVRCLGGVAEGLAAARDPGIRTVARFLTRTWFEEQKGERVLWDAGFEGRIKSRVRSLAWAAV
ncbi:hypothetical protein ACFVFH_32235 [Streptomyces sp. NPDC057697]|uniref:hypothetical protein n=1 Tax=Streptomyces sp. NPDC057697 TaxID=3346219 RepID=UPI003693F28A